MLHLQPAPPPTKPLLHWPPGVPALLAYFKAMEPLARGNRHLTLNIIITADGPRAATVTAHRLLHKVGSKVQKSAFAVLAWAVMARRQALASVGAQAGQATHRPRTAALCATPAGMQPASAAGQRQHRGLRGDARGWRSWLAAVACFAWEGMILACGLTRPAARGGGMCMCLTARAAGPVFGCGTARLCMCLHTPRKNTLVRPRLLHTCLMLVIVPHAAVPTMLIQAFNTSHQVLHVALCPPVPVCCCRRMASGALTRAASSWTRPQPPR